MVGMSDFHALNLEPGDVVGGYTLVSRLGAGAMGSVWRVEDGGGQAHAMKILRDSFADDEHATKSNVTARERLRREAMALRRISNPGVCGIDDMELDDSVAFIVTELIEGENLREDVKHNGKYVAEDLERLASKLIAAVQAVHDAGIVHRDIKPTNVMVSVSGPVLVDFGIAMGQGETHVTSTGLVMGTPGFIAPEIIDGAESDDMTDWWSVASVLAFAATGEPVFGTSPMMAVLEREASGNANLAGLPPRTLAAFRSALDPDRSKRCTPQELLAAISQDAWNNDDSGETMLPFGRSRPILGGSAPAMPPSIAPDDATIPNPRRGWKDAEETLAAEAAATQPIATGTQPLAVGETQIIGETTTAIPAANSATTAMPTEGETTAALPFGGTQPLATQPLAPQPTMPQPTTQSLPPLAQPTPQPQQKPQSFVQQPAAYEPYPAQPPVQPTPRAWPAMLMFALPIGLLGAAMPLAGWLASAALLWVMTAAGLNIAAQRTREWRRGGGAKPSDRLARAVTFPWHLARGFVAALPSIALDALITACVVVILSVLEGMTFRPAALELFGATFSLPLPYDASASAAGLSMALACAAGWAVAVYGPSSEPCRAALGSYTVKIHPSSQNPTSRMNILGVAALALCCAASVAALRILLATPVIDWWPLGAVA